MVVLSVFLKKKSLGHLGLKQYFPLVPRLLIYGSSIVVDNKKIYLFQECFSRVEKQSKPLIYWMYFAKIPLYFVCLNPNQNSSDNLDVEIGLANFSSDL